MVAFRKLSHFSIILGLDVDYDSSVAGICDLAVGYVQLLKETYRLLL